MSAAESAAEYWVMRVVVARGQVIPAHLARAIASGDLQMVNGEICEPVSVWNSEQEAIEAAVKYTASTRRPAKVTMSVDAKKR